MNPTQAKTVQRETSKVVHNEYNVHGTSGGKDLNTGDKKNAGIDTPDVECLNCPMTIEMEVNTALHDIKKHGADEEYVKARIEAMVKNIVLGVLEHDLQRSIYSVEYRVEDGVMKSEMGLFRALFEVTQERLDAASMTDDYKPLPQYLRSAFAAVESAFTTDPETDLLGKNAAIVPSFDPNGHNYINIFLRDPAHPSKVLNTVIWHEGSEADLMAAVVAIAATLGQRNIGELDPKAAVLLDVSAQSIDLHAILNGVAESYTTSDARDASLEYLARLKKDVNEFGAESEKIEQTVKIVAEEILEHLGALEGEVEKLTALAYHIRGLTGRIQPLVGGQEHSSAIEQEEAISHERQTHFQSELSIDSLIESHPRTRLTLRGLQAELLETDTEDDTVSRALKLIRQFLGEEEYLEHEATQPVAIQLLTALKELGTHDVVSNKKEELIEATRFFEEEINHAQAAFSSVRANYLQASRAQNTTSSLTEPAHAAATSQEYTPVQIRPTSGLAAELNPLVDKVQQMQEELREAFAFLQGSGTLDLMAAASGVKIVPAEASPAQTVPVLDLLLARKEEEVTLVQSNPEIRARKDEETGEETAPSHILDRVGQEVALEQANAAVHSAAPEVKLHIEFTADQDPTQQHIALARAEAEAALNQLLGEPSMVETIKSRISELLESPDQLATRQEQSSETPAQKTDGLLIEAEEGELHLQETVRSAPVRLQAESSVLIEPEDDVIEVAAEVLEQALTAANQELEGLLKQHDDKRETENPVLLEKLEQELRESVIDLLEALLEEEGEDLEAISTKAAIGTSQEQDELAYFVELVEHLQLPVEIKVRLYVAAGVDTQVIEHIQHTHQTEKITTRFQVNGASQAA